MITIDCQGKSLDERTARFAHSRFAEADFVAMHPAQKSRVLDALARIVEIIPVPFSLEPLSSDNWIPVETFTGIRLIEDPHMVKNEIHFRDKHNVTIAKIVNLEMPDGEDQQATSAVRGSSEGQG